jgi:hypothetical protein
MNDTAELKRTNTNSHSALVEAAGDLVRIVFTNAAGDHNVVLNMEIDAAVELARFIMDTVIEIESAK